MSINNKLPLGDLRWCCQGRVECAARGGRQKTITSSSLRYEHQIEVRLPLATLRVVLGNQLLIAGRPHPNVDVGWPAAVGDGHVALQAIPSSLVGKHRGPVCIVVVPTRVGKPELDAGAGDRLVPRGPMAPLSKLFSLPDLTSRA